MIIDGLFKHKAIFLQLQGQGNKDSLQFHIQNQSPDGQSYLGGTFLRLC